MKEEWGSGRSTTYSLRRRRRHLGRLAVDAAVQKADEDGAQAEQEDAAEPEGYESQRAGFRVSGCGGVVVGGGWTWHEPNSKVNVEG